MPESLLLDAARPRAVAGLRWIVRHGLLLGCALLIAEGVLQVTTTSYGDQVFDHEFTGGHPVMVQPDGHRGPPVSRAKAPREYRVLAVGDSATFGTGLAADWTWPASLERHLRDELGTTVTVINAGVEGARLAEAEAAFRERWRAYDPDLVVVAVTTAMVSRAWILRDVEARPTRSVHLPSQEDASTERMQQVLRKRMLHRFCLPSFLGRNTKRVLYWIGLRDHHVDPQAPYGPLLGYGYLQGSLPPELPGMAWRCFVDELRSLAAAVRATGAPLLVTEIPARFMLSDGLGDNEKLVPRARLTIRPTERVAASCAKLDLGFVDALAALRAARARHPELPLYIPFDMVHPDRQGMDVIAGALLEHLRERDLLPGRER